MKTLGQHQVVSLILYFCVILLNSNRKGLWTRVNGIKAINVMLLQDLKHDSISTLNSTFKEIKYAFKIETRLRMK